MFAYVAIKVRLARFNSAVPPDGKTLLVGYFAAGLGPLVIFDHLRGLERSEAPPRPDYYYPFVRWWQIKYRALKT
jgi:hypothetical protein